MVKCGIISVLKNVIIVVPVYLIFLSIFFVQVPYIPNIPRLIGSSEKGLKERFFFLKYGKMGQLINNSLDRAVFYVDPVKNALEKFGKMNENYLDTSIIRVFDTKFNKWREVYMYEIEPSYSFLPVPNSPQLELEYFLRSSCLPNHTIFWSTPAIPKDVFAKIASKSNKEKLGRFTVAPWLPKITDVPKQAQYGFLEYDYSQPMLY